MNSSTSSIDGWPDVTTFLISTEFGRTNKQSSQPVTATGTDHNPFNNLCLLGGKGIAKNKLVGASDLHSSQEILSGAHLSLDKSKLKCFGRPFNFDSQEVDSRLPLAYNHPL